MSRPKVTVQKQRFAFTWFANGETHKVEIPAKTYAEACWILGQRMALRFLEEDIPKDFKLTLTDEQARLGDDPAIQSQLTRGDTLP